MPTGALCTCSLQRDILWSNTLADWCGIKSGCCSFFLSSIWPSQSFHRFHSCTSIPISAVQSEQEEHIHHPCMSRTHEISDPTAPDLFCVYYTPMADFVTFWYLPVALLVFSVFSVPRSKPECRVSQPSLSETCTQDAASWRCALPAESIYLHVILPARRRIFSHTRKSRPHIQNNSMYPVGRPK